MKSSKYTAEYYEKEILRISKEEEVPLETIVFVMDAFRNASNNFDHVGPNEICQQLIEDLLKHDVMLKPALEQLKISDSETVGRLVHQLTELGAYIPEKGDELENFNNIFQSKRIYEYLKKERIVDEKRRLRFFSIPFYILGGICWLIWFINEDIDYLIIVGCLLGYGGYYFYYTPHKAKKLFRKK